MSKSKVTIMSQSLDANVNVFVRVIDKRGRVVQEVSKHNKATHNMTEGIIRFLRGEFNSTFLREFQPTINNIGDNVDIARYYIPTHIGLGNICVNPETGQIDEGTTKFKQIYEPSYSDDCLRSEILPYHNRHRVPIQKSTKGDSSVSDTYALTVQGYYQFNQSLSSGTTLFDNSLDTSGIDNYDLNKNPFTFVLEGDRTKEVKQYLYDGLNCITITEIGLFSGDVDDNNSKLLARLLLDPESPLILSSEDTMIINWQIGLYSLDDTIEEANANNSDYKYQTKTTTVSEFSWTTISANTGFDYDVGDLVAMKKIIAGISNAEDYDKNYDLNGDGYIDNEDIIILKNYLLEIIDADDLWQPITDLIVDK